MPKGLKAPVAKPHRGGERIFERDIESKLQDKETALPSPFYNGPPPADSPFSPANGIVRDIRKLLATDDHYEARRLAEQGAAEHPESEELQKWAAILAPPTVRESDLPPNPSIGKNFKWLRESSDPYKGQWVALLNGEFLGAAPRLRELKEAVKPPPGTLLTRVV